MKIYEAERSQLLILVHRIYFHAFRVTLDKANLILFVLDYSGWTY